MCIRDRDSSSSHYIAIFIKYHSLSRSRSPYRLIEPAFYLSIFYFADSAHSSAVIVADFGLHSRLSAVKPVHSHPVEPIAAHGTGKYILTVPDHHLVCLRTQGRDKDRMAHSQI